MAYIFQNVLEIFGKFEWSDLARSEPTCAYIAPLNVSEFLFHILYLGFSKSPHYFLILLYPYHQSITVQSLEGWRTKIMEKNANFKHLIISIR